MEPATNHNAAASASRELVAETELLGQTESDQLAEAADAQATSVEPKQGLEHPELVPMHQEAKARWRTAGIWGIISVVSGIICFVGAWFVSGSTVAFGFLAVVAFISTIGSCIFAIAHEMQTVKFEDGEIETQHIALRKARFGSKLHLLSTHAECYVYPALDLNLKHFDAVLVRRRSDKRPIGWIVGGKGYDVVSRPGYLLRRLNGAFCQLSTFFFYIVSGLLFICLLAFAR